MNTFGNNFGTAGGRELKFCRLVRASCVGTFWLSFKSCTPRVLRDIAVFVFLKTATKFAHMRSLGGTTSLCIHCLRWEILKFNG